MQIAAVVSAAVLAACDGAAQQSEPLPPTATLAPIVSQTPRFTATPIPTRTPLPTATYTPSETPIPPSPTQTFTPSPTPPVLGSIVSLQDVNVREGPGVTFPAIEVLSPGTGLEILGFSADGQWLNIRMEDGDEGWVSAQLVRIQPSPTPIPSLTPTVDQTAIALGTVYPTSVLGGVPITPTPPRSIATQGAQGEATEESSVRLPNMAAIEQTATALSGLGLPVLTTLQPTTDRPIGGPTGGPLFSSTSQPAGATSPPATTRQGVGVFALCDNRALGVSPPSNLAAGSTISIWWRWYAGTEAQVREHDAAVDYNVQLDGVRLTNWRQYGSAIRQDNVGFYKEWYVPVPTPLTAGQHTITYEATWSTPISDGLAQYGPGTANPVERGSCTFTVR